jgi:hypothetical protein
MMLADTDRVGSATSTSLAGGLAMNVLQMGPLAVIV